MNLVGECVIDLGDLDQVFQFSLQLQILLPEDGHLALDQRDRAAGNVRQAER